MTLAPLLEAPLAVQLHACAALLAFALGAVQLAGVKGTTRHRALGYAWVALMVIVAAGSFWIHELRLWGPWSPIHLLSILTLVALPAAVLAARRHKVATHKRAMLSIFLGALVIAGIFTLAPGRVIYRMLLGG